MLVREKQGSPKSKTIVGRESLDANHPGQLVGTCQTLQRLTLALDQVRTSGGHTCPSFCSKKHRNAEGVDMPIPKQQTRLLKITFASSEGPGTPLRLGVRENVVVPIPQTGVPAKESPNMVFFCPPKKKKREVPNRKGRDLHVHILYIYIYT